MTTRPAMTIRPATTRPTHLSDPPTGASRGLALLAAAKPTAAIFDMDGLLVDSEPVWRQAECEVLGALGVPLTDAMCLQTMGLRVDQVIDYWHERYPWPEPSRDAVVANLLDAVEARLRQQVVAMPGALEVLATLAAQDIPMAVASSSPQRLIDAVVDGLGIRHYFRHLVTAMDDAEGKPHPAVYQRTVELLAAAPESCLAFEDSLAGLQSAVAAGLRVIVVPAADRFADRRFDSAFLKLETLQAFDLEKI